MADFAVFLSIGTMSSDVFEEIFTGTDEDDEEKGQENVWSSTTDGDGLDGLHYTDSLEETFRNGIEMQEYQEVNVGNL